MPSVTIAGPGFILKLGESLWEAMMWKRETVSEGSLKEIREDPLRLTKYLPSG